MLYRVMFIFLFLAINAFSQEVKLTTYEKKILELSKKYYIILTDINRPLTLQEEAMIERYTNYGRSHAFITTLSFIDYTKNHTKQEVDKMADQMKCDFKNAEKLKSKIDFEREQQQLLKAKQEKIEKEKEQAHLRKISTQYGKLLFDIEQEFSRWCLKGEFEKESVYQDRIQKESLNGFNKTCEKLIENCLPNGFGLSLSDFFEIGTYSPDNEYFNLKITRGNHTEKPIINIPISQAQDFKNNFTNHRLIIHDIDKNDWCLIENGFFPKKVTVYYEDEYGNSSDFKDIEFKYPKSKEIIIPFDSLGLDIPRLKGKIFYYNKVLTNSGDFVELNEELLEVSNNNSDSLLEIEAMRQDTIIAIQYSNQVYQLLDSLNSNLIKNPYNIESQKIHSIEIDYNLNIKDRGNVDKLFLDSNPESRNLIFSSVSEKLKDVFFQKNSRLESELLLTKPDVYSELYYNINTDKKQIVENNFIECWCVYSDINLFKIQAIKTNFDFSRCKCREELFAKNQAFFLSKDEFNTYYNLGLKKLNEEIEFRILKKEESDALDYIKSNLSTIQKMNFKDLVNNTDNSLVNEYWSVISSFKQNPYYETIIAELIKSNDKLKKEFEKNSTLFSNSVEFINAYISDRYKDILKEKKN